jgi:O-methyltransferase involved in polyketide biosynthesis
MNFNYFDNLTSRYLSETNVCNLLNSITTMCAPGSRICISYVNLASVLHAKSTDSEVLKSWQFGCDSISMLLKEASLDSQWRVLHNIQVCADCES